MKAVSLALSFSPRSNCSYKNTVCNEAITIWKHRGNISGAYPTPNVSWKKGLPEIFVMGIIKLKPNENKLIFSTSFSRSLVVVWE